MTKYNKSEVNLKSTAYNQNGQNYFEQLTAYNSMSAHLRRILLTKCAVDAKNKTYIRKRKQTNEQIDYKPRFIKTEITDNIIDRLAYDTFHHPVEFLRLNYGRKYLCQCDAQNRCYMQSNISCRKVFKPVDSENGIKLQNRYEENSTFYESASDFLSQNIDHFSSVISSPKNGVTHEITQMCTNSMDNQTVYTKDEEIKYIKFMYEITHEIIRNGLYADNELQELFKKHIKKNRTILDMNRMQYEIYQLKHTLNISNNSEVNELDDGPYVQYLLNAAEIAEENEASEELLKSQ